MDPEQFNIVHKEVNSHSRTIKESHVHLGTGPHPQQEPWEVPVTSHMGPPSSCITHIPVQAFQDIQLHPTPPNPPPSYWFSPSPNTSSHLSILVRGTNFSMVSTHMSVLNIPLTPLIPPTPNLLQVLQQCHLGKFLTFYLLG